MKDYEKIINLILEYTGVDGNNLFKKQHLGKPSITYYSVFKSICENGEHAVTELNINKKNIYNQHVKTIPK